MSHVGEVREPCRIVNKCKIGNCYSTNAGSVQRPKSARESKDVQGMCSQELFWESMQSVQSILVKVLTL